MKLSRRKLCYSIASFSEVICTLYICSLQNGNSNTQKHNLGLGIFDGQFEIQIDGKFCEFVPLILRP